MNDRAFFYTSPKLVHIRKRDREKKSVKKIGNVVIYGGPMLKIAFFVRGATFFSLAIPPFKNPKLPNFANKTGKYPKTGT